MARVYANENFPFPVVEELRRLGHDVVTLLENGNAGRAVPIPKSWPSPSPGSEFS